jgi:hypothetical protein
VPVSGRLFHTSIFLFLSNFRLVRPSGFFYFHIPLKDLIFMGSTVYAEKLTDPRWQKKRLKVFERDEWACVYCKDTTLTLHVHHEKYEGENPWDTDDDYLKTVCEKCHSFIGFIRAGNVEMVIDRLTKIKSITNRDNYLFAFSFHDKNGKFVGFAADYNGEWMLLPFLADPHVKFIKTFLETV